MASDSSPAELARHRLPTNTTTRLHPVHRWMNFVAGFSPEFVNERIAEADLGAGAVLLDPFAGMSTALVAANHLGLDAVGYEPQPFFFDMGSAKVAPNSTDAVDHIESMLKTLVAVDFSGLWSDDAVRFLGKLVDPDNLALLADARRREEACPEPFRALYRLVVTRLLQGATGSKTDGIYKAPTSHKRSIDLGVTLDRVLGMLRADLAALAELPRRGRSIVHHSSAEILGATADESIDISVTSPPYLNNFDFAEMARMELYFWNYATSWRDITDNIRARMIINTTTAPTAARKRQDFWSQRLTPEFLGRVTPLRDQLLAEKNSRGGSKQYDTLVYPYFAQMSAVISEVHRCLKPRSSFHLVVSDAALYGVHIDTESLLADLMVEAGFEVKDIHRLRDRGGRWVLSKRQGSARGLGEFHIHAVK